MTDLMRFQRSLWIKKVQACELTQKQHREFEKSGGMISERRKVAKSGAI